MSSTHVVITVVTDDQLVIEACAYLTNGVLVSSEIATLRPAGEIDSKGLSAMFVKVMELVQRGPASETIVESNDGTRVVTLTTKVARAT